MKFSLLISYVQYVPDRNLCIIWQNVQALRKWRYFYFTDFIAWL